MKVHIKYQEGAEKVGYATTGSACIDLRYFDSERSSPELEIKPEATVMLHTGISIWIKDPAYAGLIFPRSGLGKKGLILANSVGVIDSDYQGEILLVVRNVSGEPITIKQGDRIAQMGFYRLSQPEFIEVDDFAGQTERGTGGFGSTGVK